MMGKVNKMLASPYSSADTSGMTTNSTKTMFMTMMNPIFPIITQRLMCQQH